MRKRLLFTSLATSLMATVLMPLSASAVASAPVYDALPSPLTPNVASLGYEATSTSEFGDYVHLAGTNRTLKSITVTMSDWALFSDYSSDVRYSGNSVTWSHPITVNVYGNHLGANGAPDTLLGTKTQVVIIPWRPVADPTCAGGTAWRASDNNCYNGKAFNATFDLSSLDVVLPNDVIVGIAYNTADYGANPIHLAGPYNSLNVGIPIGQTASVGTDDSADKVFWNTSYAGFYTDGGAGGVGVLRTDTNWTPNGTVAMQVVAEEALVTPPTSKNQCKNNGWKVFNNPSYKNQGKCVEYVEKHSPADAVKGTLKLSGPNQKISLNIKDNDDDHEHDRHGDRSWHRNHKDMIEYWNYDYPGVLHYKADVMCVGGDKSTGEARVMFQIPAGHPGLSGLYVVSYVKEVNHGTDLYGHAATGDLATATAWCQTGAGFAPAMYSVTQGRVEVN